MLTEEALAVYSDLQKLFISQGKPEISEKILLEEVEPLTTHGFADITFFWHLTHMAYSYIEYDYTQYAEAAWHRVFEMYREKYDQLMDQTGTRFAFEVVSLIANSRNEFALMQLNQGHVKAAQKEFQELDKRAYSLMTTSKYFDTILTDVFVHPDERQCASGTFIIKLRVRNSNLFLPSTLLRFRVEQNGQIIDEKETEYDGSRNSLVLRGNPLTNVEMGTAVLVVELTCPDRKKNPYQHRQTVNIPVSFQPGTSMSSLSEAVRRNRMDNPPSFNDSHLSTHTPRFKGI